MSEPVVAYPVTEILARIEAKVDTIGQRMETKADQASVHDLETRVRVLETASASALAVTSALSRSRAALWTAVAACAAAFGTLLYLVAFLKHS